jgi:hypothetical protein
MVKNSDDIIYIALKNKVGFDRSKKFKDWFHKEFPGMQQHHLFGSYSQSLKTSDYCSVPVTAEQHEKAEKDKSGFAIANLALQFQVLIKYIKHLEGK